MKLYKISQDENARWDTFDSAVVTAMSEEAARNIHPEASWDDGTDDSLEVKCKKLWRDESGLYGTWCSTLEAVAVEYLGEAKEGMSAGVVLASFRAG